MVVWGGPECRAETIIIAITANLTPIPVTFSSQTSTSAVVDTTALNMLMTAAGSHYQFTALGVTTNFPGTSTMETVTLTGTVTLPAGVFPDGSPLIIRAGESGFTSPSSGAGTLSSSSEATFTGAASTSSNEVTGLNDAIQFSYSYGPTSPSGSGSAPFPSFTTNNGVDSDIEIILNPSGSGAVTDAFSATATAAEVSSVPEPAGWVLVLSGLSLLGIARWRRWAAAPAV
jgi:hypothetical protein